MPAREIRGAIHVHTSYSDGSGSMEEIIDAARAASLDFLIVTDHDTVRAAKDGFAGRHKDLLVLVGGEVSPSGGGHCLALGDVDITGFRWMPERFYLHKLRRDGADVYIAHPEGRMKPTFGIRLRQWHAWEEEHFDGLEIWSYMHDWIESVTPLNIPFYYLNPDKAITGPDRRVLGLWDRLNVHRRVTGIGALDAHAVRMLFGIFVAFEYEKLFGTILTHVFVDNWGEDPVDDAGELRRALRQARTFVAYDALAPARGFDFRTAQGLGIGARGRLGEGTTLEVTLPREAQVKLIHNGRHVDEKTAACAEFEASQTGVYRIEVHLGGRPWIFSNPIFLG